MKSVTFDSKTLDALRGDDGPNEGKVFNLVRGLQNNRRKHDPAVVLVPLRERAERISKDMGDRIIDADRALDLLANWFMNVKRRKTRRARVGCPHEHLGCTGFCETNQPSWRQR